MMMRGFTLIEMMLSVSIIAMLSALSLPVYASFQARNDLDIATQSIAESLRRAQVYSRGMQNDSQWGVEVQSTAATLFKGGVFASRDATYDEATTIPTTITVGGVSEILFTKLTGMPATTGNITLSNANGDTRTVTINAKGMVSY
jgi:prepilin-type N-terminal cleavage/methylation domain-containing protein